MNYATYDNDIIIIEDTIDTPLFDIINDGESLYIDEHFDEIEE